MTDWTPETNRIQTMHLTADELAALKAAKWGWLMHTGSGWTYVEYPIYQERIYRAKPAPVTQDVVPWEAMCADITFAARDIGGQVYGFCGEPSVQGGSWGAAQAATRIDNIFSGYTPGTCDWRDSLQQRPQPAATGAVTEPLGAMTEYWLAAPFSQRWAIDVYWTGDGDDMHRLNTGLIHITEASAVAHAKRMTGGV